MGCNTKANIGIEVLIIIVMFLVLPLIFFIGYKALTGVNADIQLDADMNNQSKVQLQNLTDRYPSTFDGIFGFLFGLLWIGSLVAAYYFDSNPVFFIVSIILIVLFLFISMILSNVYSEYITADDIAGIESSFPIINFVSTNLLMVALIIGVSYFIVMFTKSRIGA